MSETKLALVHHFTFFLQFSSFSVVVTIVFLLDDLVNAPISFAILGLFWINFKVSIMFEFIIVMDTKAIQFEQFSVDLSNAQKPVNERFDVNDTVFALYIIPL